MRSTFLSYRLTIAVIIVSVAVVTIGMGRLEIGARAVQDDETTFGLTSLSAGQSLRLGLVNVGDASNRAAVRVTARFDIYSLGGPDTAPGCSSGSVAACTNNLRLVRSETCVLSLDPRGAATCDIAAGQSGIVVGTAVVIEQTTPSSKVASTVEIRESGRTVFVHPGAARGFNPQPDPPASN